jgi:hypothetical protein
MLKFIKNLSSLSSTHEALQNSNAIDILIELLKSTRQMGSKSGNRSGNDSNRLPPFQREISNQILNTMYNLCRHNKSRQEEAALSDIIPLLKDVVNDGGPLKEFALPVLLEMVNSGKVSRKMLWDAKGLAFYVSLLGDVNWAVTALDAIFVWYVPTESNDPSTWLTLFLGFKKKPLESNNICCLRSPTLPQPSSWPTHRQVNRVPPLRICSSRFRSSFVFLRLLLHRWPFLRSSRAQSRSLTIKMPSLASTYCVSCALSVTQRKKAAGSSEVLAATNASLGSWSKILPSLSGRWQRNLFMLATRWR